MTGFLAAVKRAAVEAVEAGKPMAIAKGKIIGVDPLQIMVDQKLILSEMQLIRREVAGCAPYISVQPADESGAYRLVINTENRSSLGIDDDVLLLRVNGGQQYIVIGKDSGQ